MVNSHQNANILITAIAVIFSCLCILPAAADIYTWEWIDPNDTSLGKQPSTTLAPDGAANLTATQLYFTASYQQDLTLQSELLVVLRCGLIARQL